jgi:MFS family permease
MAMLALVLALNYIDRSSLATAAPLIQKEFALTGAELGLLLSAFFWVYTPAQLLGGWLVHRFDVRWVLGIGVLVWGGATALMGLAGGFVSIFVLRLLLALGECVTFPGLQFIVSRNANSAERGQVSSFISSGQGVGPMLGTLFGGLAMAAFGWRAMFVGLGAITVLWVWPWSVASRGRVRVDAEEAGGPEIGFSRILRRREFWGMALGMFALNYTFYFVFIWLPTYLVQAGGFGLSEMSSAVAVIYGLYALTTFFTGRWADRRVAKGSSSTLVWKGIVAISVSGQVACIAGSAFVEPRLAVWLLGSAGVFCGLGTPALFAMTSILPGPRAAGRWAGAQAVAGQLAGVVSPVVTGLTMDATRGFAAAFLVAAAAAVVGVFAWCVIVRKVEPLDWEVVT